MSDLVGKLRDSLSHLSGDDYWIALYSQRKEAADEIERLREQLVQAQSYLAICQKTITQIEYLSDNCINAERYTTADALCDLQGIRNVIKKFAA